MTSTILFLKNIRAPWLPGFVRNASNFEPVIANYRRRYAKAGDNAVRKQIAKNFNRNYKTWLARVKAANTARRRSEQQLFNSIRKAKAAGNVRQVNRILEAATAPKKTRSAPTPRRKTSQSLFKKMHKDRLAKLHKNLRAEIANLEAKRNAIQVQINNVRRRILELPSPPGRP